MFAVVTIGFEQTSYLTMEDQGTVEVCASVVSGNLSDEVTVVFSTQDENADGKVCEAGVYCM